MSIPFIDLQPVVSLIRQEVQRDWEECLQNTWFVGGQPVTRFEQAMASRLGVDHFVSCANGTDALIVGLQALGVRPGDKVALPNLTFWATYEAVAQLGAIPILIDIDEHDLQMSFAGLRQAHAQRQLDAVVLVNLYGWCSRHLADIRRFCSENGLALLEDNAQAFGVEQEGTSIFATAQLATLSFYPAKVLGGAMDGGGMATNDAALAERCRSLCNHGRSEHYSYEHVGWNSRMSAPQAAYLLRLLPHAQTIVRERNALFEHYVELLAEQKLDGVRVFTPPEGTTGNGYLNVLTVGPETSADAVVAELKSKWIGCARTYPETIDAQPPSREAERVSELSVSREFCRRVINLPLYFGLSKADCERSVDQLRSTLAGA